MHVQNIDRDWKFGLGVANFFGMVRGEDTDAAVNLPHDYMLSGEVTPDAPAGPAGGYYTAGVAHYRKALMIPAEWEQEKVFLRFDGVMMNATVEINGSKAALHHYGYSPFLADITPYIYFGRENNVVVTVNPSMQPNSRWYSGAGIFRSVELMHGPAVHIESDGIYAYTKRIEENGGEAAADPASGGLADGGRKCGAECGPETAGKTAYVQTEVTVRNTTSADHIAAVEVSLVGDADGRTVVSRRTKIQIDANSRQTAHIAMTVENPLLWDAENPDLYRIEAKVTDLGVFRTHFVESKVKTEDSDSVLFGIRTVTADVKHGLRINGRTVKLKGGCVHHDNGLLGAVSLYDAEARRIRTMKEVGFNAIRTTHNPPSKALMEACDRLGMYVFAEAFDAWGMGKQPGDYNQFFASDWEADLTAFITRDRNHPSIVIWSTGNEITERAGLNHGYTLASKLAAKVHALDTSRPVSNGVCSFWSGLDDELMKRNLEKMAEKAKTELQNADVGAADLDWEEMTEAFTNGLDIVGYNYLEDKYEQDHRLYPDRIMLGSENFPKEIGKRWPMVMRTPYVIGDFTWTAVDYIGEAGIGKSVFLDPDDPQLAAGAWALSSHASEFPYRLANDADIDINGFILPQGCYRSVVYGSEATHVFSYDPANYGKREILSQWGFPACQRSWNWAGAEGKNVTLLIFSRAEEVEVLVNGRPLGRKKQGEAPGVEEMPCTFVFDAVYEPGEVTAVSYRGGKEISRDTMKTAGAACAIRVSADRTVMAADGHSLVYACVEVVDAEGRLVPDAQVALEASAEGAAALAGFGSAAPVTAENYTSGSFTTYRGRACGILRSGYEAGEAVFTVKSREYGSASVRVTVR